MTSSSSSTSLSPLMKNEEPRNWAELPSELTSSIVLRLSVPEILVSAQKVCRPWRRVCKDPSMWRKIDMRNRGRYGIMDFDYASMCRHAVDLSQGGLVDINVGDFASPSLLTFIADRSSNLRSLGLAMYFPLTDKILVKAIEKLPLLETLEVSSLEMNLKTIGQACPQLKTLKLNSSGYIYGDDDDEYALAIAESMPKLRHLQLLGNKLTDTGLNAILDRCPHLEHLDIRKCSNINLVGDLEKRCLERLKELRRPDDSTADNPHVIFFSYSDLEDDLDDSLFGGDNDYNWVPDDFFGLPNFDDDYNWVPDDFFGLPNFNDDYNWVPDDIFGLPNFF